MAVLLKRLEAKNTFSYKHIILELDSANITQVLAPNGYGKTNLINTLLEGLYGNNPRGYKKGDIPNSILGSTGYYIKIDMEVEGVPYTVISDRRGAKLNLSLVSEGCDLSSHTTKDTYKTIEELLGINYTLACSLMYQSATSSMEFLSATDAMRKKYLLSLLSLDSYSEKLETIKSENRIVEEDLRKKLSSKAEIAGRIKVLDSTIEMLLGDNPIDPVFIAGLDSNRAELEAKLAACKEYNSNLMVAYEEEDSLYMELYKAYTTRKAKKDYILGLRESYLLASSIDIPEIELKPVLPTEEVAVLYSTLQEHKDTLAKVKAYYSQTLAKINSTKLDIREKTKAIPKLHCDVCNSVLDNDNAVAIHKKALASAEEELLALSTQLEEYTLEIASVSKNIEEIDFLLLNDKTAISYNTLQQDKVSLLKRDLLKCQEGLIDTEAKLLELGEDIPPPIAPIKPALDPREAEYQSNIQTCQLAIHKAKIEIEAYERNSLLRSAKITELATLNTDISKLEEEVIALTKQNEDLSLLADVVKNTITFVIESSVNTLQGLANNYLTTFTGGQFQIQFKIDNDKLNVLLFNNGKEMSFYMASAGQAARVSTAVLLAIRNLLDTVSRNKLNFLMLDEVLGVLDSDGKEALFEVLSAEQDMNIFLVSHEYSHPLFAKVELKKDADGCTFIEEV